MSTFLRKSVVGVLSAAVLMTSFSTAYAGKRERDIAIGAAAGVLGAVVVGGLVADSRAHAGQRPVYNTYSAPRPVYQEPTVVYREVPVYRDVPVYREAPVVYYEQQRPIYREAPRYRNVPRYREQRYVAPEPRYSRVALSDAHVSYCYDRYRSYRESDNTFQPNHGPRRQCR